MTNPFSEIRVVGELGIVEAAEKLEQIGEQEVGDAARRYLERHVGQRALVGLGQRTLLERALGLNKKWAHTAHALGFIEPSELDRVEIVSAGKIRADNSLRTAPLTVSLNGIRIAEYPGGGTHNILLGFYIQNAIEDGGTQHVHFNAVYRGREGEHVGVIGQPIFRGVSASEGGLSFRCLTVNVKNEDDERFVHFLDSDVFKDGLKLLKSVQPAVAPLSEMALALVKGFASRNRNVPVQDIYVGLDFASTAGGARLACGTYVAVQIPETKKAVWNWENWIFDKRSDRIVLAADGETLIPYNYICIGVTT